MTSAFVQNGIDVGLMASASSDHVINFLKDYGEKQRRLGPYSHTSNDELEKVLLDRDDPAINIALATNATNSEVLATLFSKSKAAPDGHYSKSLRLAILSNDVNVNHWITKFPEKILSVEDLTHLMETRDEDEIYALFENKIIDPKLLEDLYSGDGLFENIDQERRRRLVMATAQNSRLITAHDSEDGPDMNFSGIHGKLFELLENAPVHRYWVSTLDGLFNSLNPFNLPRPDKSVLPILERWKSLENPGDGIHTDLTWVDEFRCLIGALYGSRYDTSDKGYQRIIDGSLTSDDVAVRCAFYGKGKLDESIMRAGFEKDGSVYVLAAMNNESMLMAQKLRYIFETEHLRGNLRYRYLRLCKMLSLSENRGYFDPRPIAEWLTETIKEDRTDTKTASEVAIEKLTEIVAQIDSKTRAHEKLLRGLKTSLIWAVLILGGIILART